MLAFNPSDGAGGMAVASRVFRRPAHGVVFTLYSPLAFPMKPILTALLVATMTWLTACETIPVQEMSDARQAYRAAQQAGAERYAPALIAEVKVLMEDADRFLAEGRYSLAGKVAERARALAIKARKKALAAQAAGS